VSTTWRKLVQCSVDGSVATGLLKISPDFLSKKIPKNLDKETKFKSPNISTING